MLLTDLFTVLLSGDETGGQFGVFTTQAPPGRLIPAHNHYGTQAATQAHDREFLPGFGWSGAQS